MAAVLDGVAYGLQLALLAVGLTMIYGLGGVLNLAHGQFAVVTGIAAAVLLSAVLPAVALQSWGWRLPFLALPARSDRSVHPDAPG